MEVNPNRIFLMKFNEIIKQFVHLFIFVNLIFLISNQPIYAKTNNKSGALNRNFFLQPVEVTQSYEYILPSRKVVSCPSFASFKFSCQNYHVITIDSLTFSPVLLDSSGECTSDWSSECRDEEAALEYSMKECSGKESCSLISYLLRSRTKCNYHQVISIHYKCIPSWEVTDVPIKCDICKNVTIQGVKENYGFIHSAWYPKLYPRVTCHSLIQNKPDHIIVIYSVSGSIGLDRIIIESVNQFGVLVVREIITGNLTTQLVLTSAYDVNVTVLPEDSYFFEQRRFLLYFYIVPKCYIMICSNISVFPPPYIPPHPPTYLPTNPPVYPPVYPPEYPPTYPPTNPPVYPPVYPQTNPPTNPPVYPPVYPQTNPPVYPPVYPPVVSQITNLPYISYATPSTPIYTALISTSTNIAQSTYAPIKTDQTVHHHHSRISDAWLAAILALIYSLLMVFAVIVAIYCRRRRKRRLQETKIILSPSSMSTSQIINPISRSHSQVSLRETGGMIPMVNEYNSANSTAAYLVNAHHTTITNKNDYNNIYSHVNRENQNVSRNFEDYSSTSSERVPVIRQTNYTANEFDNYSQVITEEDNFSTGASVIMNYGDVDIQRENHAARAHINESSSYRTNAAQNIRQSNLTEMNSINYPYTLKTNTNLGSIIASETGGISHNSDSLRSIYRAVEYTKSPKMERCRVKNSEDEELDDVRTTTKFEQFSGHAYKYDIRGNQINSTDIKENMTYKEEIQNTTSIINNDESEKTFVVKLFPLDEQEKEVQEMTMYVDSSNDASSNVNLKYSRI